MGVSTLKYLQSCRKVYPRSYIENLPKVDVSEETVSDFAGLKVINACVQFREEECTAKVLKNLTGRYYADLESDFIFRFCRSKSHKNFKMERNPRKEKWTKAYRRPELFNNTDLAIMETLNYARLPESVTMSRVFSKVQRRLGEKADLGHVPSWISTADFEMALKKADLV
ncbi:probable ribosome biogenesis protein RLP24 [Tanacetum coccineum]